LKTKEKKYYILAKTPTIGKIFDKYLIFNLFL